MSVLHTIMTCAKQNAPSHIFSAKFNACPCHSHRKYTSYIYLTANPKDKNKKYTSTTAIFER